MKQYEMLPNIRQHSIVVARVAEHLVDNLHLSPTSSHGQDDSLNKMTVIAGALLHDIAKTQCLNEHCDHARLGAEICLELGFPEIGRIVEEHVILKRHDPAHYAQGIFSAREIVYYADKRVRHDEIVSLTERLDYIISRYGRKNTRIESLIRNNFNKCVSLEKHLFSFLDFPPDELPERVLREPSMLLDIATQQP